MNKREFLEELKKQLNVSDEDVLNINSIFEEHMIIGKKNKEKIISDLEIIGYEKDKAENIYNTVMNILSSGIKESIKHPFRSKVD